ncbi:MAG: hypothetical protein P8J87_06795, partial [Verrucomicrobiales bacterium]|nr:hypothetical protein [Verrucomicrobiales bacterium]
MKAPSTLAVFALLSQGSFGAITGVTEVGLGGDTAAVIETGFGEESLTFSDRTHQHNGAAFDSFDGLLSTNGDLIVPLPDYLLGNNYVRFANNARDQGGFEATVTTDIPSKFYLLLDNRVDGIAGNNSSPNTEDAVLGGSLQWVIDGGWERVNTGISPDGQADYTAVDEGGDGVGPGQALNQFYSVWTLPTTDTSVTVSNNGIGGNNMISLVAAPDTGGVVPPVLSFVGAPPSIFIGEEANLIWRINPTATSARLQPGDIDVLPLTDAEGSGSQLIFPQATTTYSLTVITPDDTETEEQTITVRLLEDFSADQAILSSGQSATLSWLVRPDASVTITPDIGATTDNGVGSATVTPTETTTYTLDVTAGDESASATITIFANVFAAVDIGGTDGQTEPGAGDEFDFSLGAGPGGTNGTDLFETPWPTKAGGTINITIDSIDQFGFPNGGLDWRDRGDAPPVPLARLAENHVKNNAGTIRVTLGDLPAGTYDVTSFHIDPTFSQGDLILIEVTDALVGDALPPVRNTGIVADASWPGGPASNAGAPQVAELNDSNVLSRSRTFSVTSDGANDVIIFFDGFTGTQDEFPTDTETPLNGLILVQTDATPTAGNIRITSVERDSLLGDASIAVTSETGKVYALFTSPDLVTWTEADDQTASGTNSTFTHASA